MLGPGVIRYLSGIVLMELRAGARTRGDRSAIDKLYRAYIVAGRLVSPTPRIFDRSGSALRQLRLAGCEVRSAAFVHDVLIALTAREIGATVVSANVADFEAIQTIEPFLLERA